MVRRKRIPGLELKSCLSGEVVHAQVFRDHLLIVNSVKAATELFERRARIYSDRPTIPMIPL
jgi:hypothetical protein